MPLNFANGVVFVTKFGSKSGRHGTCMFQRKNFKSKAVMTMDHRLHLCLSAKPLFNIQGE